MLTRTLLGLLLAAAPTFAVDLKALKPEGYLSDFARVVDADSKAAIESYARAVEDKTGVQMSLVTLETLDGEPLEDVSIDLFRQFGVGQKGKDNGVQLLLVIRDRRSRLEVGNGLEPVLPDGFDGQILLDMRPELQAGHYGQALLAAAQQIGQAVAQAQGVSSPIVAARPAVPHASHDVGLPWPLIVFFGLLLLSIVLRGLRGGYRSGGFLPGFFAGAAMGGGFGGSHDSGGSSGFGGFGGGDAGGGGASSGW